MYEVVNYCPECRAEYREGFVTCSDCETPLVRRLESETGDQLVPLSRQTSFEFVADLLENLEQHDIPYMIQAGTALHLLDAPGEPVARSQPWEARIWVTSSRRQRAKDLYDDLVARWRQERGAEFVSRYLHATF